MCAHTEGEGVSLLSGPCHLRPPGPARPGPAPIALRQAPGRNSLIVTTTTELPVWPRAHDVVVAATAAVNAATSSLAALSCFA